tara:strand:+ start:400 stop:1125 length:726 start_codon:yes stop_codon:yes gene_type:complete
MSVHLITYGNNHYTKSRDRLVNEAIRTGWFSSVIGYGEEDMSKEYKEEFKDILHYERGAGYWIWKPYFILKRLSEIEKGDVLIYLDAGCTIRQMGRKRFYEYINMLENGCMISFRMSEHIEKHYTTKEIFEHFGVSHMDSITDSGQYLGGIRIMKNNEETLRIMQLEYDTYKENRMIVTDCFNDKQEDYFVDNRHEQSIFSVIRKMHKTIVLEDETKQFPLKKRKNYPFFAKRIQDRHLKK